MIQSKVQTCSRTWLTALNNLYSSGRDVAPRDIKTKELLHQTFAIDLNYPVLMCPDRKLNYKFMAAEAYWILTGDDTVAGIKPYNSRIAQFSDDGIKFEGAYGPRIKDQFYWVHDKLLEDLNTRQAGLIIWRDNPQPSRDIPCTIAIWFSVRDGVLNAHVFMRSSDVWLGLPYDIFNFSMLAWLMTGRLNESIGENGETIQPGTLYLTAVSSHLYETNTEAAKKILENQFPIQLCASVPSDFQYHPDDLIQLLKDCRKDSSLGWWQL